MQGVKRKKLRKLLTTLQKILDKDEKINSCRMLANS